MNVHRLLTGLSICGFLTTAAAGSNWTSGMTEGK
ncbi:MAG: hypothetical protein JWM99_3095, partial [Verrucomicrobiales bacterium]|nr:hypothetical protein [Verrucomicrobiales bacterium]